MGIQLTKRQLQVVELLAAGASCPEIARKLRITVATVYVHVRAVAARLPNGDDGVPALRQVRKAAAKLLEAA